MKAAHLAIAILPALLLLCACSSESPVCAPPYIAHGATCCLDKDADGACDVGANGALTQCPALDCSLCAPQFVTQDKQVPVYKYVCQNGSVMDAATGCTQGIVSDARLFTISEEQDPLKIAVFEASPACRGTHSAAELHVVLAQPPLNLTIQVKDSPTALYRDLVSFDGSKEFLNEKYVYVGFCDDPECAILTDAQLPATGAYAVRAQVVSGTDKFYTRELLLDPTPQGAYGSQRC